MMIQNNLNVMVEEPQQGDMLIGSIPGYPDDHFMFVRSHDLETGEEHLTLLSLRNMFVFKRSYENVKDELRSNYKELTFVPKSRIKITLG